jgi:hypothetical protein
MPTIRIWDGCKVVAVVTVSRTGSSHIGGVGGAENSTPVDVEIDPWKGLIVDNGAQNSPKAYREVDQ